VAEGERGEINHELNEMPGCDKWCVSYKNPKVQGYDCKDKVKESK